MDGLDLDFDEQFSSVDMDIDESLDLRNSSDLSR